MTLATLDARAKLTFDAGARKPALTGTSSALFGRGGLWSDLKNEVMELDGALRAVRPTSAVAARALLLVGDIYDALAEALAAWAAANPPVFTNAQAAKLTQLRSSGRDDLIDLANDIEEKITEGLYQELDAARANAVTAYLGAFQLSRMSPTAEVAPLHARAESRVHDLFPFANPRLATRTLRDPTSDSPGCLLDLVDPTR